jgi:hypothetical protein
VNEKEVNHPAHPMDRTANWCSHGGLVHSSRFFQGFLKSQNKKVFQFWKISKSPKLKVI